MTYPIIELSDNAPELPEQQGKRDKYWIHREGKHYLLKIELVSGENWAEKVACELCTLLGLPHAHYDFAVWKGRKGVITESIVPPDGRLVSGNELLSETHSAYADDSKNYGFKGHTLGRILKLLGSSKNELPIGWTAESPAINNAIDVFLGYLLLDAWIANQDRHHENWGVINFDSKIYLAPTYDHAASLGHLENDIRREYLLKNDKPTCVDNKQGISHFVTKAKSAIYAKKSDKKPMKTLEAFQQFGLKRPEAAKFWLQRLSEISAQQCEAVFMKIPETEITKTTIEFSLKLLELNKKRLLEVVL